MLRARRTPRRTTAYEKVREKVHEKVHERVRDSLRLLQVVGSFEADSTLLQREMHNIQYAHIAVT